MGAAMAGLVSAIPQLVWLSKYKLIIFSISLLIIIFAGFMHYKAKDAPCPADPAKAKACNSARKWSLNILIFSAVLWFTGAFFAFIAPLIF